jgi:hypothetical protein
MILKPILITSEMKLLKVAILFALPLMLNACMPTTKVASDYAKEIDFKNYKSYEFYGWAPEISMIIDEDQKGYIENAVKSEMAVRNIKQMRGGDLLISVYIIIDRKTAVTSYTQHYSASALDYSPGWGWFNSSSPTVFKTIDLNEGTMIIDIFDNHTQKIIWQGVANRELDKTPKSIKANLEKTVASILANFPPKAI